MLTVEDYGAIRRAHRDGLSVRAIARQFRHSRRKIRQVLAEPEPRRYTRSKPPRSPKLDPFKPIIDQILIDDEQAPRKQRHQATQIFRRLVAEHGFTGGYDQVRRYVTARRRRERETFMPLAVQPGQRAEADFGQIAVDFPDGRRQVSVLLCTWAYSYAVFAIALPSQRTEAVLHGLVEAFRFFDCVPHELWWDNPTTVAIEVLRGRQRRLHERYAALASHYRFEPLFCLPARGNEKPHVENRVKNLERRWATPVPQMHDLAELNAWLRTRCVQDQQRIVRGQTETIAARWAQERSASVPLPAFPFDPCIHQAAQVDKYQTVTFDRNRYSVPRTCAFQAVTVKGYVDRVEVVSGEQVVARHERSYGQGQQLLDPRHYLAVLAQKPAYLDHTDVFRGWQLPSCFEQLRAELEADLGARTGARHYVRVLQLLAQHSVERLEQAIVGCRTTGRRRVEAILAHVERLHAASWDSPDELVEASDVLRAVQVPRPDLNRFDLLLSPREPDDEPVQPPVVAQGQSEDLALAGHVQ